MARSWCPVCCSDHPPQARCPGDAQPSRPEREGWKVTAETPDGLQGFGVLLAPVGARWRARVLSYPRTLWTVPGGGGTMKFFGRSEREAERAAAAFVRSHCIARGFVLRDELAVVDDFHLDGIRPATRGPASEVERRQVEPRFPRQLPVVFGTDIPKVRATSINLSKNGLFVQTTQPLDEGALVGLLLELEHGKIPLRGSVKWRRDDPGPGRPSGMGVRLTQRPRIYTSYIDALA